MLERFTKQYKIGFRPCLSSYFGLRGCYDDLDHVLCFGGPCALTSQRYEEADVPAIDLHLTYNVQLRRSLVRFEGWSDLSYSRHGGTIYAQ